MPLVPSIDGGAPAGVFVVASFPDDEQAEVTDLVWAVVLAGLGILVISTAVAWSVAGGVVRPVRDLTRTARRITDSDLSARIPVEGHDELAELATTFNDMVDRLDQGFRAQRRFLDDVAHELRTPITIARGHLEVLGDDPGELVAELFDRVRALGPRSWTLERVPPAGAWTVLADSVRLEQAILNLAANAVQHTTDGAEIGIGGDVAGAELRLWVRDTGPGVDAVARAQGGVVEVHSQPGAGATFPLLMPFTLAPSHLAGRPLPPPTHLDTITGSAPS